MEEVNSGKYLSIMGMINMKWKFDWEDLRRKFINIRFNSINIYFSSSRDSILELPSAV